MIAATDGAKWLAGLGVGALILFVIFAEKWADRMAVATPAPSTDKPNEKPGTQKLTIARGFIFGLGIALAFLVVEVATTWATMAINGGKVPTVPMDSRWR